MTLHNFTTEAISLPSMDILHLMVSETWPKQDIQTQGHYGKVKGNIKVAP